VPSGATDPKDSMFAAMGQFSAVGKVDSQCALGNT
jgi:hypothetical protein